MRHIHGHPHAGTDQVQGQEPPHCCRQQFANQAEGQEILCERRQETLSLARHPHGQAHRQGCPRHRGSANLQSADPQPDSGNGDEKVAIVFVGNLHFA